MVNVNRLCVTCMCRYLVPAAAAAVTHRAAESIRHQSAQQCRQVGGKVSTYLPLTSYLSLSAAAVMLPSPHPYEKKSQQK